MKAAKIISIILLALFVAVLAWSVYYFMNSDKVDKKVNTGNNTSFQLRV